MDGYRCVKYIDLCRICSSADDKKVNIFTEEGSKLNLQKKIEECLPVSLNERDKLPKFICSTCLEYVEFITEFRKTSLKAQEMLKSCLNTSKLTNGGQVYIKNEPNSPKKFLKAIKQNKLQNKVQIITTSPILNSQAKNYIVQAPIKKTTSQGAVGSDFLSSIIRAAGIQTTDDTSESQGLTLASPTQIPANNNPQYTVTLDGTPSKTGHYQFKIENANTSQSKNIENVQQNVEVSQVAKSNSKTAQQKQKKDSEDPKSKKPKINFIVQTTPSKEPKVSQPQQSGQILNSLQTSQPKTFGSTSTLNTPVKTTPNKSGIQIQDIKILPKGLITTPMQTPNKQYVVPIMLKNENTSGGNEMMTSTLNTNNNSGQITYVQMKLQPNTDGQPGFHLAPATMPLLSPQAIQQLSFASPQHIQQAPQIQSVHSLQQVSQANQTEMKTATDMIEEMDQDDNIDFSVCDMQDNDQDNELHEEHVTLKNEPNESSVMIVNSQIPKTTATTSIMPNISSTSTPKKQPATLTVVGVNPTVFTPVTFSHMSSKKENSTPLQSTNEESPNKSQDQCDMATNQLAQLSSHSIKHQISNSSNKSGEINLTTCDVCKKVFKKKEHLMQHLKSHIGLRPFKCKDEGCNKTFSRKEHLLRHELSHTGTKMFSCDLCHKLFSRKDNLNKHRRIHPEAKGGEKSYTCPVCEKTYTTKNQFTRCKESHELDIKVDNGKQKKLVPKPKNSSKKVKTKEDKLEEPVLRVIAPNQQQQQQQQSQIVTIVQQQPQQQLKMNKDGQQVMQLQLAMPIMSQNYQTIGGQKTQTMQLQPDQAKQIIKTLNAVTTGESNVISGNTLFTMPPNFVINPTTFVTASGELVNSFKIENQ